MPPNLALKRTLSTAGLGSPRAGGEYARASLGRDSCGVAERGRQASNESTRGSRRHNCSARSRSDVAARVQ